MQAWNEKTGGVAATSPWRRCECGLSVIKLEPVQILGGPSRPGSPWLDSEVLSWHTQAGQQSLTRRARGEVGWASGCRSHRQ